VILSPLAFPGEVYRGAVVTGRGNLGRVKFDRIPVRSRLHLVRVTISTAQVPLSTHCYKLLSDGSHLPGVLSSLRSGPITTNTVYRDNASDSDRKCTCLGHLPWVARNMR
jgi:hypothetical protein